MANFILTGAGFTRNWGAWLAGEVFEYLLSCHELDDALRQELWADWNEGGGFESTLGRLQQAPSKRYQMEALEEALIGMFQQMDKGLRETTFEFGNSEPVRVSVFLEKFDAIFTLNQDLLLERRYFIGERLGGPPGVNRPPFSNSNDAEPITVQEDVDIDGAEVGQPYFKLHGSQNWRTSVGGRLLVMGGNKAGAIGASPLLQKYQEAFSQRLMQSGARLMIVGYGFGDQHINNAIRAGCENGLEVFIVDPLGVAVLGQRKETITREREDLIQVVQRKCIGASRRPISTTFNRDWVEHARLMRFFDYQAREVIVPH